MKRLQFQIEISAEPTEVYNVMLDEYGYKAWTSVFQQGSYFIGNWQKDTQMRFMSPEGDGMIGQIGENTPGKFVSILHQGYVSQGKDDFTSEEVTLFAGAHEDYTFVASSVGTTLTVDIDVLEKHLDYFEQNWPIALQKLKFIVEEMAKLRKAGYQNVSVCPLPPNADLPEHTHDEKTAHVVLNGVLSIIDSDGEHIYKPGDSVEFAAGTMHKAKSDGDYGNMIVGY